jgi:hypothetical protein
MSVSTVVRNVLLTTFGLVEDIVNDGADIALAVTGQETRAAPTPWARATTSNEVVAWQDAVLNVNAVCDRCNAILPKGRARRRRHPRAARAARDPLPVVPGGLARPAKEPANDGRTAPPRDDARPHGRIPDGGRRPRSCCSCTAWPARRTPWRHVLPALARRFTVVAPDLLGHGATAKPRRSTPSGAHANVLRDLMAALGTRARDRRRSFARRRHRDAALPTSSPSAATGSCWCRAAASGAR